MRAFLRAAEGIRPSTFCMASSRWVCRGPAKCLQTNDFREARPQAGVPRIVQRYRGFRQGTDNERSRALGGSAGSHVAVESASAWRVREPDSCCSSRRRPRRTNPAALRGRLLVHRSSSDDRAIQRWQTPVSHPERSPPTPTSRCALLAEGVAQTLGGRQPRGGMGLWGDVRPVRPLPPDGSHGRQVGASWCWWSLSRLWVAVRSRHSDRTADLPRRRNRFAPRSALICPKTGSTVPCRFR